MKTIDATRHWPPQVARVAQEYVNDRLSPDVKAIAYVSTTTGKTETIQELHPTHAKNALAKILRELASGKLAYLAADGTIQFI